jgi:polyhydroxybutyrate depolymerase
MRLILSLSLSLSLALSAVPAQAFASRQVEIAHDGLTRAAILDVAPGLTNAPLLIALHGGIGGPSIIRRRAGVSLAARGWAVAWPEAVEDWSDGRLCGDGAPCDDFDDVGYLRALVALLAEEGIVDPARVFVAGPSIGGMMTLRVMCDAPDLVAGVAVAIASLPVGLACPDGPPVPALVIHSTADEIVPPGGGRIGGEGLFTRDRGAVRPVDDMMALLAARNGCAGATETPLPDRDPGDDSTALRRDFTGCEAPLVHFVVENGGHTWPGSRPFRLGATLLGATNQDFSATREVEAFFSALAADPPQ